VRIGEAGEKSGGVSIQGRVNGGREDVRDIALQTQDDERFMV
jgi:hypothetical protein